MIIEIVKVTIARHTWRELNKGLPPDELFEIVLHFFKKPKKN